MPQELKQLYDLPYNIFFSFLFGYVGYWLAYHGYENISGKESIFKIFVFSFPCFLVLKLCPDYIVFTNHSLWLNFRNLMYIFIFTIFIGIFWRKWGKRILYFILRGLNISNENNINSVLNEIHQNTKLTVVSVTVVLKDNGGKLVSTVDQYKDLSFSGYAVDKAGSVGLYVDSDAQGERLESKKYYTLSYIPKEEIARIDIEFTED